MLTIQLRENNIETGIFRFPKNQLTRSTRNQPSVVSILANPNDERTRVTRFIEALYRKHYGARIRVRYPNLISVRDSSDTLVAAAGFRFADKAPLFLEKYMAGRTIEDALDTPRHEVVEIGNLASNGHGMTTFLFIALASHLSTVGVSSAVVTSTKTLERRFRLLGLEPKRLCAADPSQLTDTHEDWGTYYDTDPYVLAGNVEPATRRLRELFGENFFEHRPRLFPRLHFSADH